MRQLKPVDVVIAGGGFVGLTLAKEITARTSLSVVVLERGQTRKLPITQPEWMSWTMRSGSG